jgi:hypothetical protein
MPDPDRTRGEFEALLSRGQYASIFHHRNEFRKPTDAPQTAASLSAAVAKYLWQSNALLNPVEVVELKGPLELYRAHDGGSKISSRDKNGKPKLSAGTLGWCWFDRSLAESAWLATSKFPDPIRRKWYFEFLRTTNFVLPEWNSMLHLVCMDVPPGASVVVARGRGNWRAMRTPLGQTRPGGALSIHSPDDVILKEKIMPLPGTVQYVVPLYSDMWIQPVEGRSTWPLLR